jgi:hypothetical protein
MRIRFLILFILAGFISCSLSQKQQTGIKVTGKVIDSETGIPVENAEVLVICQYLNKITEASDVNKNAYSGKQGEFIMEFEKGFELDAAAKKDGYYPACISRKLAGSDIAITISLPPSMPVQNDVKMVLFSESIEKPVISFIDSNSIKGYDFINGRLTTDRKNADIYIGSVNQSLKLRSSGAGGIFPLYYKDFKSSILFEHLIAPDSGYLKEYDIKKGETGFFIKCRDGNSYVKLIIENIEENSISFSYLFNFKASKTFFIDPSMDLQKFIVDYCLK